MILHEMLTGGIPVMRVLDIDEYFRGLKKMSHAEIIKVCDERINNLLLGCLSVDVTKRYGVNDISRVLKSYFGDIGLMKVKSMESLGLRF